MKGPSRGRNLLRDFGLEVALYSGFVAIYFFLVLRYLDEQLTALFHRNLTLYTLVTVFLLVGQAVLLEWLTRHLVRWVRLRRGRPPPPGGGD